MCGISGIYYHKPTNRHLRDAVAGMIRAQKRRGPDDEGVFISHDGACALGHNRLSIIDLSSAGHQPMTYEHQASSVPLRRSLSEASKRQTGALWITFNGEIYNFQELRRELENAGYKFRTKTDTEVILALFDKYGEAAFQKLRGMFAFGLWDKTARKLYLVKDRYGIKPLYYFVDAEKIVFASTVKAIIQSGLVKAHRNSEADIGFLLFGSAPLPHTTVRNVSAVPAGMYVVCGDDGAQLKKYYEPLDYFVNKNAVSVSEAEQRIRNLLGETVDLHMFSDAPLGVFLSGGVDSSALALLASAKRDTPITTVSITFREAQYSEKKYQDIIREKVGSRHHESVVTREDFLSALPDIFSAMDQPTVDGVNTYFVSRAAKDAGLKAVLSGLGADEIFFGYPYFRKAAGAGRFSRLPYLRGVVRQFGALAGDRYTKMEYAFSNDPLRHYLAFRGLFGPQDVKNILGVPLSDVYGFLDTLSTAYRLRGPEFLSLHPADRFSYLELKFYLQNQLLKDADFMAMHHGIETRVPFLDHKLVEYVSGLPIELKFGDASKPWGKQLLIGAVQGILPREIYARKKMGFTFPFQEWLPASSLSVNGYKSSVTASRLHWSRRWALEVYNRLCEG